LVLSLLFDDTSTYRCRIAEVNGKILANAGITNKPAVSYFPRTSN
jgi:hypothetical protein